MLLRIFGTRNSGYKYGCLCVLSALIFFPLQASARSSFSDSEANRWLSRFTKFPHPFGSEHQQRLALWMRQQLKQALPEVWQEDFTAVTPVRSCDKGAQHAQICDAYKTQVLQGQNVFASVVSPYHSCLILIGSHYDTKHLERVSYVGANDSASSSLLLAQQAKQSFLNASRKNKKCGVVFIWFDGEESVLPNWDDGETSHLKVVDHTYGSRRFASSLSRCLNRSLCMKKYPSLPIKAFLLVDMVGHYPLKLTNDGYSDKRLRSLLKVVANELGYQGLLAKQVKYIEDDHIPFRKLGIPSLNLIGFEYLDHWHKGSDTRANFSMASVKKVDKILTQILDKIEGLF